MLVCSTTFSQTKSSIELFIQVLPTSKAVLARCSVICLSKFTFTPSSREDDKDDDEDLMDEDGEGGDDDEEEDDDDAEEEIEKKDDFGQFNTVYE